MLSALFIPTAPWERAPSPFCSGGQRNMVAHAARPQLIGEQKTSFWGLKQQRHCPLQVVSSWEAGVENAGDRVEVV